MNEGKVQKILVPYGKMSLTDYVTQSLIGSFLYFGYGLELHLVCGTTYSLLIGIFSLCCRWHLLIGGSVISVGVRWKHLAPVDVDRKEISNRF